MTMTIRICHCGQDHTLNGYIFTDFSHAQKWLSQEWIDGEDVTLEEIEVGPFTRCSRCDGSDFRQDTKTIGRLTLNEVLEKARRS